MDVIQIHAFPLDMLLFEPELLRGWTRAFVGSVSHVRFYSHVGEERSCFAVVVHRLYLALSLMLFFMSHSVIHNMSSKVPFDLIRVDISVLTPVLVIDNEYHETLCRHHRLCENREDERKYKIIVSDPEER
ncbi:hypothetical protein Ahy_A09g044797 isoform B [Arachis hypogaea]|uniref:Uncharacterized protein n=1 Tax=Arachis hypogaea TaxID=3818 RepID=A0A445BKR6_ARAHY|nr:hypothetical protein Ahy_A09g044797 isoform B [Arachis hypogaea]